MCVCVCVHAQNGRREQGHASSSRLQFVRDGALDVNQGRQFLLWLGEAGASHSVLLREEQGTETTVSFKTFDIETWPSMAVDAERDGRPRLPREHVMALPGLAAIKCKLASARRMASPYHGRGHLESSPTIESRHMPTDDHHTVDGRLRRTDTRRVATSSAQQQDLQQDLQQDVQQDLQQDLLLLPPPSPPSPPVPSPSPPPSLSPLATSEPLTRREAPFAGSTGPARCSRSPSSSSSFSSRDRESGRSWLLRLSALRGVVWGCLSALCVLGSPRAHPTCAPTAKLGAPPVARCGRRWALCLLMLTSSRAAPLPRGGWQPGEQAVPPPDPSPPPVPAAPPSPWVACARGWVARARAAGARGWAAGARGWAAGARGWAIAPVAWLGRRSRCRSGGVALPVLLLLACAALPGTDAARDATVYSVRHVPSPRRELQTVVSDVAGLTTALADASVGRIVLAAGHYSLAAELSVTRSVVLEAAVAGAVVLDAQADASSRRRVMSINPGSSGVVGVVQLIGLNITGGYVDFVCSRLSKPSHRPRTL